ncbi:MAG TPA: hypothetical protein VMF88_00620 [Bacteroidota bacterium]|nr:hypothetical protein [Bacteroidota bacterium]
MAVLKAASYSGQRFSSLRFVLVFFLLMMALCDCGCNRPSSDSVPPGAYAYTSYDTGGTVLVRGWLKFAVADSTSLSGEWHFAPVGTPERIGPQTGDGNLVGGVNGEKIWIELNPKVRNNNLQLNGTLAKGRLAGQWTWISNDGMANQGTFSAEQK